jgi:hypothetical protein
MASPSRPKKRKCRAEFEETLHYMATPLSPIINMESGLPHLEFPRNHLAFHLLTSDQLDRLARHYHQVWPLLPATLTYPFEIRAWVGAPDEANIDIATKRQRFGHFIGMWPYTHAMNSGLPQPYSNSLEEFAVPTSTHIEDCELNTGDQNDNGGENVEGDQETTDNGEIPATVGVILEWMACEWEVALREARGGSVGLSRKH